MQKSSAKVDAVQAPTNTAEINRLYETMLVETLTPPDVIQRLMNTQSMAQKEKFVAFQLQQSSNKKVNIRQWGERDFKILQKLQQSQQGDLSSLTLLKVSLTTASKDYLLSFFLNQGPQILMTVMLKLVNHAVISVLDAATLYECCLCWKLIMNNAVGMQKALQSTGALDVIAMCVLFQHKPLALLALEILAVTAYSDASSKLVLQALKVLARRSVSGGNMKITALSTTSLSKSLSPSNKRVFFPSSPTSPPGTVSSSSITLFPLISSLVPIDLELKCAVFDLLLQLLSHCEQGGEDHSLLLTELESIFHVKDAIVPQILQQIDLELQLLELDGMKELGTNSNIQSPSELEILPKGGRLSRALSRYQMSSHDLMQTDAAREESNLMKKLQEHRDEVIALRFLLPLEADIEQLLSTSQYPLLGSGNSGPFASKTIIVLQTKEKRKRKGMFFLRTKVKRSVFPEEMIASVQDDIFSIIAQPSSSTPKSRNSSGSDVYIRCNLLHIMDMRTFTLDGDILHYSSEHQQSLLELVINSSASSSNENLDIDQTSQLVVSLAFASISERDSFLQSLHTSRNIQRLQRSSYGQLLFNNHLTKQSTIKSDAASSSPAATAVPHVTFGAINKTVATSVTATTGAKHSTLYTEAFRLLRRFYRATYDYESFLRSERERRKLTVLAARSPSTRLRLQQHLSAEVLQTTKGGEAQEGDSHKRAEHDVQEAGTNGRQTSADKRLRLQIDEGILEKDESDEGDIENATDDDDDADGSFTLTEDEKSSYADDDTTSVGITTTMSGEDESEADAGCIEIYETDEEYHERFMQLAMFLEKEWLACDIDEYTNGSLSPSIYGTRKDHGQGSESHRSMLLLVMKRFLALPPLDSCPGLGLLIREQLKHLHKRAFQLYSRYQQFPNAGALEEEEDAAWWENISIRLEDVVQQKLAIYEQWQDSSTPTGEDPEEDGETARPRVKSHVQSNIAAHEQAYRRMAQLAQHAITAELELQDIKAHLRSSHRGASVSSETDNTVAATVNLEPPKTKEEGITWQSAVAQLRSLATAKEGPPPSTSSGEFPTAEVQALVQSLQILLQQRGVEIIDTSAYSAAKGEITDLQKKLQSAEEEISTLKAQLAQSASIAKAEARGEQTAVPAVPNRFEKFEKMKKMLPEGAVRQKMAMDGISPEDIELFFSGKYLVSASQPAVEELPPQPPTENRFSKYEKMKKMLPEGAVRQKMAMDNISEADMDLFFSGKYLTETAASTVSTLPKQASNIGNASGSSASVEQENPFAKYEKMKKMLPEGAVRQKMAMDGISEKDMDAFFSGQYLSAAAAPPAAQEASQAPVVESRFAKYEKMKKMLPEGAIRQKMAMDNISPEDMELFFSGKYLVATSAVAPTAPANLELLQRFEKYEKMKKMLPVGAVRQKMAMDGVSEADVELFVSGKYLEPGATTANSETNKEQASLSKSSATSEANNKQTYMEKYEKMRKILPEGAVRQKMVTDNVLSPTEIDQFFFGKKTPINSPKGSNTGSVAVAPVPVKKSITKPLYWIKVSCAPKEYNSEDKKYDKLRHIETIWQEILRKWHSELMRRTTNLSITIGNSSSFMNANVNALCVLPNQVQEWVEVWFANPPPSAAASKKANQSTKNASSSSSTETKLLQAKKQTIVDSKRAQNILIVLGRVRRAPSEIKRLVVKLQQKYMTAELTANLRNILPTPEEIQQLQSLLPTLREMHTAKLVQTQKQNAGDQQQSQEEKNAAPNSTAVATAVAAEETWIGDYVDLPTSFLYFMSTVPQIAQRLQCHEQIFHWTHNMQLLQNQFVLLQTACDEISHGWEYWQGLLGVILAMGNAMNAGNSRFGEAQAVKLELLEKLPTMKCTVLPAASAMDPATAPVSTESQASASAIIQQSAIVPVWQKLRPTASPSTTFLHLLAMILSYTEDAAAMAKTGIIVPGADSASSLATQTHFTFSPSHTNSKSVTLSVHNISTSAMDGIFESKASETTPLYSIPVRKVWMTSLTTHWKALWAVPEMSVKQLLIDLQQLEQQVQFADEQLQWYKKQTKKEDTVNPTSTAVKEVEPSPSRKGDKKGKVDGEEDGDQEDSDGYRQRLEVFLAEAKPLLLRVKAQVSATEDNIAILMAKFLENYYENSSEGGNKTEETSQSSNNSDPAQRFFKILVQFAQQLTLAAEDNARRLTKILKQEKLAAEAARKLAQREQRQKSKTLSVRFTPTSAAAVTAPGAGPGSGGAANQHGHRKSVRKSLRRVALSHDESKQQQAHAEDIEQQNNLFSRFHAQQQQRDASDENLLLLLSPVVESELSPVSLLLGGEISPNLGQNRFSPVARPTGPIHSTSARSPSRSPIMSMRFVANNNAPAAAVAVENPTSTKDGAEVNLKGMENNRPVQLTVPTVGAAVESQRAAEYRANMIKSVRFAKPPSLR